MSRLKGFIFTSLLLAPAWSEGALPQTPQVPISGFDEPLVSMNGDAPGPPDLETAWNQYRRGPVDEVSVWQTYLESHSDSPWRASLCLNLGLLLARNGRPGAAMEQFKAAWDAAKNQESQAGQRLANRAVAEWMWLCVKVGDEETLERLTSATNGRPMTGVAGQRREDALRALYAMKYEPKFYLCGPTALATVGRTFTPPRRVDPRDIKDTLPTQQGTSLFQLAMMAANWDIPLQMAKREPGAKVIAPTVMHLKVGHWVALVEERDGRYRLQDDVLEESQWVSQAAIDAEMSGYALIPFAPLPDGWSSVGATEGKGIFGRGRVGLGPWYGPYPHSAVRPKLSPAPRIAQAGVRMGNISLEIWATALSLPLGRGETWPFELRFQQRMTWQCDDPPYSYIAPHWTFTGLSFLLVSDLDAKADVHFFTEDGGWQRFTDFNPSTGIYAVHPQTWNRLNREGDGTFTLRHPDGSVERFDHKAQAGPGQTRYFRTNLSSQNGPSHSFEWDESHRLTHIRRRSGEAFHLDYLDPAHAKRLSAIRNSKGQSCRLIYDDLGRLERIETFNSQNTKFTFPTSDVTPDLPSGMITPQGVWDFQFGQERLARWVNLRTPQGKHHKAGFFHDVPGIPPSDPVAPPGPLNQYLQDRSTYYWSPGVLKKHGESFHQAEAIRYLFNRTQLALSWTLEAVKSGTKDRIWFTYVDQPNPVVEGPSNRPIQLSIATVSGVRSIKPKWDFATGNPLASGFKPLKVYTHRNRFDFEGFIDTFTGLLNSTSSSK